MERLGEGAGAPLDFDLCPERLDLGPGGVFEASRDALGAGDLSSVPDDPSFLTALLCFPFILAGRDCNLSIPLDSALLISKINPKDGILYELTEPTMEESPALFEARALAPPVDRDLALAFLDWLGRFFPPYLENKKSVA